MILMLSISTTTIKMATITNIMIKIINMMASKFYFIFFIFSGNKLSITINNTNTIKIQGRKVNFFKVIMISYKEDKEIGPSLWGLTSSMKNY